MANAYAKAGVDVNAGYEVVSRIKKHVEKTKRPGMMGTLGSFGGCFDLSQLSINEPVLVSGTDGVGTKLLVAIEAQKHDTIGIDCVAMCVNDILAQGAEPLYFLDYIAAGKNHPEILEQVVSGVAKGCQEAGAGLIGGETAEMPGMYGEADYDLAGFAVGIVEKSALITGDTIKAGDVLIGLSSSGLHSNGYSLVRQILFEENHLSISSVVPELDRPLSEVLLEPTRIYTKQILPLCQKEWLKGISHITGGGFVENLPRMLPEGLACQITLKSWPVLPIFKVLQKLGNIASSEMYEIFNMGIGMVLVVAPENATQVQTALTKLGEETYRIGQVVEKKDQAVILMGDKNS